MQLNLLRFFYLLLSVIALVSFAQETGDEGAIIDLDQPQKPSTTDEVESSSENIASEQATSPLTYSISVCGDISNSKFARLQQSLVCDETASLKELPSIVPSAERSRTFLFLQPPLNEQPASSDIGLVMLNADNLLNENRCVSIISQAFARRISDFNVQKPKPIVILLFDANTDQQAYKVKQYLSMAEDSLPPSLADFGDTGLLPMNSRYNVTIVVTRSEGDVGVMERAVLERAVSMANGMTSSEAENFLQSIQTTAFSVANNVSGVNSCKDAKKIATQQPVLTPSQLQDINQKIQLAFQKAISSPKGDSAIVSFLASARSMSVDQKVEDVEEYEKEILSQAKVAGHELKQIISQEINTFSQKEFTNDESKKNMAEIIEKDELFHETLASSARMQGLLEAYWIQAINPHIARIFNTEVNALDYSVNMHEECRQLAQRTLSLYDKLVHAVSPYEQWMRGVTRWQGLSSVHRLSFQQRLLGAVTSVTTNGMVKGFIRRPWRRPVDISIHTLFKPSLLGVDHRQDPLGLTARDKVLYGGDLIAEAQEHALVSRSVAHKATKSYLSTSANANNNGGVKFTKKQVELAREMLMFPLSIKNPNVLMMSSRDTSSRRKNRLVPTGPRDPNDSNGPEQMIRWDISPMDEAFEALKQLKTSSKKKQKNDDDDEEDDEEDEESKKEKGVWAGLQRRFKNHPAAGVVLGYKQPKLAYKMR